jgi:hypothetical protein
MWQQPLGYGEDEDADQRAADLLLTAIGTPSMFYRRR